MSQDVQYTPTPEELDTMHQQLQALDMDGQGVNPSKLRVFYPRTGWNVIYARLYALRDAGRVQVIKRGSPVPLEYFHPLT
ncbi:MAG: hypothetical protein K8I60_03100 [Anaerolineae bacterium]|nr:hypothetical protein [Anaerolineae bacterium]